MTGCGGFMKLGWKLQRLAYCAAFAVFLLASALPSFALELIVIENPFTARSLSGTVVDSTGAPVPGAVVEECEMQFSPIDSKGANGKPTGEVLHGDCAEGPITATTETSANGHFSLPRMNQGKTYYLHVSSPGFDPMQITVKLRPLARVGVRIRLHIAT
jgi:hypothetical protein